MKLVYVLVQHSILKINNEFVYFYDGDIKKYSRVEISFNNQHGLYGFVTKIEETNKTKKEIEEEYGFEILNIDKVIDDEPIIDDVLFSLVKKISEYYFYPLIGVIKTMLPPSLRPFSYSNKKPSIRYYEFYKLNTGILSNFELNNNELKIIEKFKNNNNIILKKDLTKSKSLESLLSKKIISIDKEEKYSFNLLKIFNYEDKIELNDEQKNAYNIILNSSSMVHLLNGVTGSGKTEIYIKLVEENLKNNKTSLVLVPEIGLTPLMISRFLSYFNKDLIGVLHSGLSDGEKYDEYRKIKNGRTKIVIGTRSSIFAPLSNLGLIIIDEEHDESYKQTSELMYNAIDVALFRAKDNNVKVVLGSATPSIESMSKAKKGIYNLIEIKNRFNNAKMPKTYIVDRCDYKLFSYSSIFSLPLIKEIKDVINKNEQVILLINNKGYSRSYYCRNCGHTFKCPTCNTPLFYHKEDNTLRCHRCEYKIKKPSHCPECNGNYFGFNGFGIEKVEEEFNKIFKGIRYISIDGDRVKNDEKLSNLLSSFDKKEANVLIGTQMVCKGHDFKDVTLVGILNADTLLNFPNYKSSFNCFSLIYQAIGRSGRNSKQGKAIIQTSQETNYAIKSAINLDYESFYNEEIKRRHQFKYPPFYNLLQINISSRNEKILYEKATLLSKTIKEFDDKFIVLGPSIISKNIVLKELYTTTITIKNKNKKELVDIIWGLIDASKKDSSVNISVEII